MSKKQLVLSCIYAILHKIFINTEKNMFAHIFGTEGFGPVTIIGIGIIFAACFYAMKNARRFLPGDSGNDVTGGAVSKGKPTGAGIIFIIAFDVAILLFTRIHPELFIYMLLVTAEMISGFLDDKAKIEWSRLKKGLFDLGVSVIFAITYLSFNPNTLRIAVSGYTVAFPVVIYFILIVAVCWFSINVTNCADGVDGLTGTLSIVTLLPMLFIMKGFEIDPAYRNAIVFLITGILVYLFFNANPSKLLMGDAGSRAVGLFIAMTAVKMNHPFLYLLLALVLLIDGGLGLIKITMIRATKNKNFLAGVRTPVHDHFRKVLKWSDTQVVIRFASIQAIIAVGTVCYLL